MKKELTIHLVSFAIYFLAVIVVKQYFSLSYLAFVIGGLLGVFLPDLDHLIYVYITKPLDLTSQRVNYLVNKNEIRRSVELLYETRGERKDLIFHTIFFEAIFFVLMFLVLTSSGSLLGKGLVISFMLHLCVDQFIDLKQTGNIDGWFRNLPFKFDVGQSRLFWVITTGTITLMGLAM